MIRVEVRRLPNGVVLARGTYTWWAAPYSRARELFVAELDVSPGDTPEDVLCQLGAYLTGPDRPSVTAR